MATYTPKAALDFSDLWTHLNMTKDSGGRWVPSKETPEPVVEYLRGFRYPSRAWPLSYAKALVTQKFAKHLTETCPDVAVAAGVAQNV